MVGFFDDDDNIDLSVLKEQLDDQVDVDKHSLYDLRKGKAVSEGEYRAMGELESKRRALRKEMKMSKDNLPLEYKTETFNDNTGIGETPLGRLSVNLIEIDGPHGEDIGDNIQAKLAEKQAKAAQLGKQVSLEVLKRQLKIQRDIKIKCSVRATRKGTKAAAPFGNLAF